AAIRDLHSFPTRRSSDLVEFDLLERRRDFVLDDLDPGFVADDLVALLDRADAADVQAHGGIELERVAARGSFGVAEHDADLHAEDRKSTRLNSSHVKISY